MPRSSARATSASGDSWSPHQSEPRAHVPKPTAEVSRSVVPNVRRRIGPSLEPSRLCKVSAVQRARRFLLSGEGWPYLLVPFIPIAIALDLAHAGAGLLFTTSALGVIPT